jgi:DNA-binding NarL/FixJ family response regulator
MGTKLFGFRILIVEDNAIFRELLKQTLRVQFPSMEIFETTNAKHALRVVGAAHPDLIFMDIKLPGESGLELAKRIKARHPKIVIILLTSFDLPEYREEAKNIGVSGFLLKGSTSMKDVARIIEDLPSKQRVRVNDDINS